MAAQRVKMTFELFEAVQNTTFDDMKMKELDP